VPSKSKLKDRSIFAYPEPDFA